MKVKIIKVMKFHSLQLSVRAYLRNLNTHSTYKNLRKARTELRNQNKPLDSLILSKHLDKYAETGSPIYRGFTKNY